MRLAGHPLHPMLVHFPVALWTAGVALDVGGLATGSEWVWPVSFGSYAAGIVSAVLAMLAGFLDLVTIAQGNPARDTAVFHMLAMSTAWLLFLVSLALRGFSLEAAPSAWAIAIAVAGFLVMVFGAWLGGQLVYRFGVGVAKHQDAAH
ncbi:MAG TPA: DUF2231 domain-containing protein [Steroidobacteraceae bacterium]|jgi:uncharacterized membrane protein|nr:DUF2231 domain-containing protein [Steroidobacteraceae bacterium]